MPLKILMPALSPTMTEGNLAKWLKKEGDKIAAGDVIAEIETDKATMEFEATDEGTLGRILIAAGSENVKVNEPIAWLLEEGETANDLANVESQPATPVKVTLDAQAVIANTDSMVSLDDKPITDPISSIEKQDNIIGQKTPVTSDHSHVELSQTRIFVSPLARRIADQAGINLHQVTGTGPKGRIIKFDIESYQASHQTGTAAGSHNQAIISTKLPSTLMPAGLDEFLPTYDEIKLSNMRKVIAKRLTEAKQTAPHFYLSIDVELDALIALRLEINKTMVDEHQRVSVNDFIIKACALALKEVPAANTSFADSHMRQYHTADISVAVAVEGGLMTPVIRSAESKSLSEISASVKELVKKARAGKLLPEDYQGGTFSLSNLGMHGIKSFSAILNPPQACILAVGAGVQKPVVKNNQLAIATVMNCTLSVDHRVVDGAVGAEFFKSFKKFITHPVLMLI